MDGPTDRSTLWTIYTLNRGQLADSRSLRLVFAAKERSESGACAVVELARVQPVLSGKSHVSCAVAWFISCQIELEI